MDICYFFVADSNKVLAFVTGISAFLFFKNLKIGYSKRINKIAASTFGVLMIHANSDTMRQWLWKDICNNVGAYQEGNALIHAVVSVAVIYVVCTIIDMITFDYDFSQRHILVVSDDCTVEKEIKVVFNSKEQADGFKGMCFSWE